MYITNIHAHFIGFSCIEYHFFKSKKYYPLGVNSEYYYCNESTVEKAFFIQSIINRIIKPFFIKTSQ